MPAILRGLKVDEGSLVDNPANKAATVVFFKRADDTNNPQGDDPVEELQKLLEELSEETRKAVLDQFTELDKKHTDLVEKVTKLETDLEEAKKAAESDDDDPEDDPINKNDLPEEVRKRLEETEAKAEELQKRLDAERDTRLTTEFISKAQTLSHLQGTPEEMGEVLKNAFTKLDEEEYSKLFKALENANEIAKKSEALFREYGKAAPNTEGDDAHGKLVKLAKAIQAKSDGVTFEKAYDEAMRRNPDLYNEYLNQER